MASFKVQRQIWELMGAYDINLVSLKTLHSQLGQLPVDPAHCGLLVISGLDGSCSLCLALYTEEQWLHVGK